MCFLAFYSIVLVDKILKKSKALHGPVNLLYHPRYGFIKGFLFLRDTCHNTDDVIDVIDVILW